MLTPTLRSKVDQLWDKFWSGGIANPLAAMEQISYLLFIRRLDATDAKRQRDAKFTGEPYTSVFGGTYATPDGKRRQRRELRWSEFKSLPGDELLAHVRDRVFPFIKSLGGKGEPFAERMQDAVFLIPKASLLVEAVAVLDEIYDEIEREQREARQHFQDVQGDLYEVLLDEIATAGKNGQFRTPRHVIQMICALVDPRLGELVCDPACGTGGFLLGAFQHVLTQHTSPEHRCVDENGFERGPVGDLITDRRQWDVLRESAFTGYDFDTTMVRIGLMNLMLHGIDGPQVRYADTLSKKFGERDRYDVVLANPPFKGNIDKGDIHEDLRLKTTKTELLFVERILLLLRMGGRAGVIVPDGVLFGSSNAHRELRRVLLDENELKGVVSLPSGVFKPYAGVSTAVLVFTKGGRTENVWFYDVQADGYSLDDKREKVPANDLPDVLARWRARDAARDTDRTAKAFFVPAAEIREAKYDLSINRYKEVPYEPVTHEEPREILRKLRTLDEEIRRDLEELEGMLR